MTSLLVPLLIFTGCRYVSSQVIFQAEAYSEGSCIKPPPPKQIDANWLVTQKTFYVPLASQGAYHRFAESFVSRVGVTEEDVHSMCLTIDLVSSGPGLNITNTGFDLREIQQSCKAGDIAGHFYCIPVKGGAGTNPIRLGKADYHIAATDNNSFLFIVRCIETFFKDYLLLTTKPAISQDVYNRAVQSARELGFDDRRVELIPYDACLRTDRFISAITPESRTRLVPSASSSYGYPPYPNHPNDLRGSGSLVPPGPYGPPFRR